jgi:hypothetical protein
LRQVSKVKTAEMGRGAGARQALTMWGNARQASASQGSELHHETPPA